jgi:BirA family biotin operon repressor/biotin-[acetyl-CoA-carboxylase] ligase
MQTAGKGRRGRQWQSPAGTNIYFTILVKPDFSPDKASMLTLVMALSVAEAIEELVDVKTGIKWPNDIVVNRKKVVGMLTEMAMTPELDEIQYVVIGTGVNVNTALDELPEEIRETATSLKQESGQPVDRAALLERMLARFEHNYEIFERSLDLSGLAKAYEQHLINVDAQVRVLDPAGEYTGISRGITRTGELIVEREDGSVVNVYAGEVSVRGLYGYV